MDYDVSRCYFCEREVYDSEDSTLYATHGGGVTCHTRCIEEMKTRNVQAQREYDEEKRDEYRRKEEESARTCRECGATHHNNADLCTSCFKEKFGIG